MMAAPDKRGDRRMSILGDLHGEVTVFERMVVREISTGGAQIETSVPLHLNSLHHLRLALGDTAIVVLGRVVHSRVSDVARGETTYRSGVEFVDVPEAVAEVIAHFIRRGSETAV